MTDRRIFGTAIVAAMLAAVVAVPFSVCGQPMFFGHPDSDSARHVSERSRVGLTLQTCLRYAVCTDEGREGEWPLAGERYLPESASISAASGVDRRFLYAVHGWDSHMARLTFGAADASAYPVFAAAPIALWGMMFADHLPQEDAVAGTVALAAGFGTTMLLKRIVGRPRPYASIDGFSPRSGYAGSAGLSDSASFPSGHATLAGIIATASALLIRHPAATAGAVVWAGSVSISRLWLGVHYPSDVVTGAALGSGASLLSYTILR